MDLGRLAEIKGDLREATVVALNQRELENLCGNALVAIECLDAEKRELDVQRWALSKLIARLVEWQRGMGGFEAPCWRDAERYLGVQDATEDIDSAD